MRSVSSQSYRQVEPNATKIILVMDNLNVHAVSSLYKAFAPDEAWRIASKLEVHYTPKHGSWPDIAEIGIHIMSEECLNRRIASFEDLKVALEAWSKDCDLKFHTLYPVPPRSVLPEE